MVKSTPDLTSKERKQRLQRNILSDCFTMPSRCYHCVVSDSECKVDLRTGRCSECAKLGQSCNQQITRIEYEKIRKAREKVARDLEQAEEEEDELTRKLLEHRSRVRRLRKQLKMRNEQEAVAQDREVAAIAESEQLERELEGLMAAPVVADIPPNLPLPLDGRLWLTASEWRAMDGASFSEPANTPVLASSS